MAKLTEPQARMFLEPYYAVATTVRADGSPRPSARRRHASQTAYQSSLPAVALASATLHAARALSGHPNQYEHQP